MYRTLRTIGALTVLVFIGALAVVQLWPRSTAPMATVMSPPAGATSADGETPLTTLADTADFVYRVGLLSGPTTDNFWAFYGGEASVWNAYVLGPTKPALYSVNPSTGAIDPEFATAMASPTQQEGIWSVVVPLSNSMSWADGLPVTAYDIVYTFETVRALELGGSWATAFPEHVSSLSALSPSELRVEFADRPTLAVWPHGVGLAPIMPAHAWEALTRDIGREELYAMDGGSDIGGGPLSVSQVGTHEIISVGNGGYPFGSKPDYVIYTIYESESEAVAALGEGSIDSILSPHGLTANNSQLAATYPAVSVDLSPSNGIRYLGFNLDKAPMADVEFRTAVALLLDRQSLAASIPQPATASYTFVSPANPVWFDPAEAQELEALFQGTLHQRLTEAVNGLRDAGYRWDRRPKVTGEGVQAGQGLRIRGNQPEPLTILSPGDSYDPTRAVYAQEIAQVLNWIGFDVEVVQTDFESVVELAFEPDDNGDLTYDMYLLGWTLGSPARPDYYRSLFASDGQMNNTGYASDEFSVALEQYESAYTLDQAKAALWEMEAMLARDLPYLLLYSSHISEAHRTDRIVFGTMGTLGGIQGRLGAVSDVVPVG